MKRRNVWKKEEAVSPVIATILMVAITVVLAATLYMMLPGAEDSDATAAMSGRKERVGDNIIISIDGGNVPFNNGEDFRLYNRTTGASIGVTSDGTTSADVTTSQQVGTGFYVEGASHDVWFNDNDNNGRVNGGDTIVIVDANNRLRDDFQFRISDTNLAINL